MTKYASCSVFTPRFGIETGAYPIGGVARGVALAGRAACSIVGWLRRSPSVRVCPVAGLFLMSEQGYLSCWVDFIPSAARLRYLQSVFIIKDKYTTARENLEEVSYLSLEVKILV